MGALDEVHGAGATGPVEPVAEAIACAVLRKGDQRKYPGVVLMFVS
jgi:hypothetical protein